MLDLDLSRHMKRIQQKNPFKEMGKVLSVSGLTVTARIMGVHMGSVCQIVSRDGHSKTLAEVIGFKEKEVILMPLENPMGIGFGSKVIVVESMAQVQVGSSLLGRVLNGLGEPIDGLGPIIPDESSYLYKQVANPLTREPIREALCTGVRAIDGFISIGKGQRMALMAGSGVGKSVLMGMIAKSSTADVNVIALIGERGREVREFIEHTLDEESRKKTVIVAVTSDQSPLLRKRGAFLATTIAEYFSSQGKDVFLTMDSVTRFAMAQREIGLNAGEPPTSKAYTPSVFSLLPQLLERAGNFDGEGSITGLYTVFVEGDDMDEPIADAVRSITDGHIILDRKFAEKGHYPAIDVLQSTSRVQRSIISKEHLQLNTMLRREIAVYRESEDLINIGAYKIGTNPKIDQAIRTQPLVENLLQQDSEESSGFEQTQLDMLKVVQEVAG